MRELLSKEETKWAYEKWCTGYTLVEIADALFVCDKTVERTLRSKGLKKVRPKLVYP